MRTLRKMILLVFWLLCQFLPAISSSADVCQSVSFGYDAPHVSLARADCTLRIAAPKTDCDYDQPVALFLRTVESLRAPLQGFAGFLAAKTGTAGKLVTWVDEGGNLRAGGNPGMRPNAYNFQSGVSGARSSVLTGRSQAPYLSFTDKAGNVVGAKFDGIHGSELIDRKLNPFFSAKAVSEATRQAAVAQHYGLQAVWELPTPAAVNAANRFMQNNNINGIIVRLAQ